MNKREYCESRESIAYYSGLNGLEIKGIEYGINDYVYCVSGAWGGGKAFHRCKIYYPAMVKIAHFSGCMGIKFRLMNVSEWGFNYELYFQNNGNNERIQQ